MQKSLSFLILVLTFSLFSASSEGAEKCEGLFTQESILASLESSFLYYQQVYGLKLPERELRSAAQLAQASHLKPEEILVRYKELDRLTRQELNLAATRLNLLQLSTLSLVKKTPSAEILRFLGVVLGQVAPRTTMLSGRTYRQQTPHRIHLALVKLALLSGRSPGEMAFIFNERFAALKADEQNSSDYFLLAPVDRALQDTLAEVQTENPHVDFNALFFAL